MPPAIESKSVVVLPALYGLGTALPVFAFAVLIAQGIAPEKVLETVRIVRFALASKIVGGAKPIFETLSKQ